MFYGEIWLIIPKYLHYPFLSEAMHGLYAYTRDNPLAKACGLSPPTVRHPMIFVALLFYVHGKHLRSCRDGQFT